MAATESTVNRDWIAAEFSKGIEAKEDLAHDAQQTAASPPDPSLGLLYHEIAAADERHLAIIETIATRYGHNPTRGGGLGLGETLSRFRDKVGEMGSTPQMRIEADLRGKASSIHWCTAWVQAFQAVGDAESASELAGVLTEEKSHHDALQEGLNRLVIKGATTAA